MKAVRIILNILIVVYVVFITLLLTGLLEASTFFNLADQAQVFTLYKVLLAIGAVVLLVKLLADYHALVCRKHDLHMARVKINDLKAELYDERQAFRNSPAKPVQPEEPVKADN